MVVFADSTDPEDLTPGERLERLYDLPPSAKLVYAVLEADPDLDQSEIADRARLSKRTTRHALGELTDENIVARRISPYDARRRRYRPLPVDDEAGVVAGGTEVAAD